ncbi:MAG TPA: hypothetical protein VFK79_14415 [Xanthobacteraceae bacterium]|nr:hypothetical protein [Xanthobacteraceae bacterium]
MASVLAPKKEILGYRTGWLTWQDLNRRIPFLEMAFEFSAEFHVILPKSAPETNPTRAADSRSDRGAQTLTGKAIGLRKNRPVREQ